MEATAPVANSARRQSRIDCPVLAVLVVDCPRLDFELAGAGGYGPCASADAGIELIVSSEKPDNQPARNLARHLTCFMPIITSCNQI